MIYWYEKATGKIVQRAVNGDLKLAQALFPPDQGVVAIESGQQVDDINEFFWGGSGFIQRQPKPAEQYLFDWSEKTWKPQPDLQWFHVRRDRDAKLAKTDHRVIRSVEDGKPMTKEWKDYRQALRDITKQPDPFNVVWPVEPPG